MLQSAAKEDVNLYIRCFFYLFFICHYTHEPALSRSCVLLRSRFLFFYTHYIIIYSVITCFSSTHFILEYILSHILRKSFLSIPVILASAHNSSSSASNFSRNTISISIFLATTAPCLLSIFI